MRGISRVAVAVLALAPVFTVFYAVPASAGSCSQTVTTTNDSGAGSLRSAMSAASNGQTICFNIAGSGAHVISAGSQLPTITHSITIDGTSQPGYAGAPLIEIDGVNAGSNAVPGLYITGGGATIEGVSVTAFSGDGIIMPNNGSNIIEADYVGIEPDGVSPRGNGHSGIGAQSSNNTIGGTSAAQRNVVSGNGGTGIALSNSTASGNTIEGNYIGTNSAGTAAVGNGADGVLLDNAPNNTVGGTTGVTVGGACTGACNLSSGNTSNGFGILAGSASGNTVAGNYAGLDVTGKQALPNGDIGFEAQDAPNNTIGGTTPAARNVFSGNLGAGVSLTRASSTGDVVEGNYIGVDVTGMNAIGNHKMGVNLGSPDGSNDNAVSDTIGGTTGTTPGGSCTGACNVISGNYWSGIYISGATGGSHNIVGNFIGPAVDGGTKIGNRQDGVGIVDSPGNHFGGPVATARNLISGNGGNGIAIVASDAIGTRIEGNYIGEGTDTGCMPNAIDGVVDQAALDTTIIGDNIWCNGFLGIDLGNDGVTANDPGDGDRGANDLQNYPVLNYAIPSGSNETINGTLVSNAYNTYRIDFFTSPACDKSGHGQGQQFIGTANTGSTDSTGYVGFTYTMPGIAQGLALTATATQTIAGNETSEFSTCIYTPRPHPDGTVIRPTGSQNLFLIESGQVRQIGSVGVLNSYNISGLEIKDATPADTNMSGSSNLYFREGTVLRGNGPDIYVIDQTSPGVYAKRHVTSINAFNALGYTAGDIIQVTNADLPSAAGGDIGTATAHPDGTVVKDPGSAAIYMIDSGQKRIIGSVGVLTSLQYTASQIKPATSADLALTTGANMNFREGALVEGSSSDVYVIDNTGSTIVKRRIASGAAFAELEFNAAEIIHVPDSDLAPFALGPQV